MRQFHRSSLVYKALATLRMAGDSRLQSASFTEGVAMSGIRYFAYVSAVKVAQMYEQISDLSDATEKIQTTAGSGQEAKVTGGIKGLLSGEVRATLSAGKLREISGTRSDVQKLQALLSHIDENETIADLNELCRQGSGTRLQAFAYSYRGEFRVPNRDGWRSDQARPANPELAASLRDAATAENEVLRRPDSNLVDVSSVATLESKCFNYTIEVACSLKHFTYMGAHKDGDEIRHHPHSGNHHFFSGQTSAFLEGLIFVTAVHDRVIVGSPLFLNYYLQDGLVL
jgi:hypothetical protein